MQPQLAVVNGSLFDLLAPHKAQRFINRDSLDVFKLVCEHVDAVRTAAQKYRVFLGIAAPLLLGVFLACAAWQVHSSDFARNGASLVDVIEVCQVVGSPVVFVVGVLVMTEAPARAQTELRGADGFRERDRAACHLEEINLVALRGRGAACQNELTVIIAHAISMELGIVHVVRGNNGARAHLVQRHLGYARSIAVNRVQIIAARATALSVVIARGSEQRGGVRDVSRDSVVFRGVLQAVQALMQLGDGRGVVLYLLFETAHGRGQVARIDFELLDLRGMPLNGMVERGEVLCCLVGFGGCVMHCSIKRKHCSVEIAEPRGLVGVHELRQFVIEGFIRVCHFYSLNLVCWNNKFIIRRFQTG